MLRQMLQHLSESPPQTAKPTTNVCVSRWINQLTTIDQVRSRIVAQAAGQRLQRTAPRAPLCLLDHTTTSGRQRHGTAGTRRMRV